MPSTPSHEETTYPACRGPPKDAVASACGHTFCGALRPPALPDGGPALLPGVALCTLQGEGAHGASRGPCAPGPSGGDNYEQHAEKIYFFCKVDAEFLCMVCWEGPSHRTHPVGILDGVVQPYWDHLWNRSEALSLEKKEMEDTQRREDGKPQALLTHIESKRQQVDTVLERLQLELMDQQRLLQARLRDLERKSCMERDEYIFRSSEEVARLGAQAQELKEQSQQPARVLLQTPPQREAAGPVLSPAGSTCPFSVLACDTVLSSRGKQGNDLCPLQPPQTPNILLKDPPLILKGLIVCRYETKTFVSPETISPDLVEKIRDLHRKILPLPVMLRTFSAMGKPAYLLVPVCSP
ncbi:hypothetical protein GH733_017783 [Mirounga leonina]|nr:hypothetical protein GH733_017783 [Mirounga leonina]